MEERNKEYMDIWKINGKIVDLNPIISIIALNANSFNQDLVNFFKKTDIKNVLGFGVSIMSLKLFSSARVAKNLVLVSCSVMSDSLQPNGL